MINIAADMVGIFGVSLIVLAYFLISSDRLSGKDPRYHLLNLIGAIAVLLSLLVHWNLPSFIIEVVWIAVSLYGLWRHWKRPRAH